MWDERHRCPSAVGPLWLRSVFMFFRCTGSVGHCDFEGRNSWFGFTLRSHWSFGQKACAKQRRSWCHVWRCQKQSDTCSAAHPRACTATSQQTRVVCLILVSRRLHLLWFSGVFRPASVCQLFENTLKTTSTLDGAPTRPQTHGAVGNCTVALLVWPRAADSTRVSHSCSVWSRTCKRRAAQVCAVLLRSLPRWRPHQTVKFVVRVGRRTEWSRVLGSWLVSVCVIHCWVHTRLLVNSLCVSNS